MGYNDEREWETPQLEILEAAIQTVDMNDAQLGISRLVLANNGDAGLTAAQRAVWADVVAKFLAPNCSRCGEPIPDSEVQESWDHEGMCGWCISQSEKD